jgi:hypothetical protein
VALPGAYAPAGITFRVTGVRKRPHRIKAIVDELYKVTNTYSLNTSIEKTKVMVFMGKHPIRQKFVLESQVIEQVNKFNALKTEFPLNNI